MPDGRDRPPTPDPDRLLIGWREYVSLPEWGIRHLPAKTDTGAKTSVIDAYDIQELPDGRVKFTVVISRKHPEHRVDIVAPISRRSTVKSSTGHTHVRLFVTTQLKIGPVVKPIEISLISRHKMKYRMLIGRAALSGDFTVDPTRARVLTRKPKRKPRP